MKTLMAFIAVMAPVAAFAHAHLESSTPATGSTVQTSPANVTLVFSEPVGLNSLKLQKAGEKAARDLKPLPQDESVHLMVPLPKLADGDYTLSYVAVSSDQHEAKGTIAFKVSATAKHADAPATTHDGASSE